MEQMTIYFKSGKCVDVSMEVGKSLLKNLGASEKWRSFTDKENKPFLMINIQEVEFIAKKKNP